MKPALLIVDDDDEIRAQMRWALADDYETFQAEDRSSALELFDARAPFATLLDLGLPPRPSSTEEGLAVLSDILARDPLAKVVIISGQGEKKNTLEAIGSGAYDFLNKPVDIEELKLLLKRCFHVASLEREYREMRRRQPPADGFEGMLGSSPSMQRAFESVRKVATSDAPVLILGESGTGKEMVAQAIHARSGRKDGPFVPINCSAIPESLLESELFGHEKGAFTGADSQRKGKIEQASGGTLFLDEIGDVPLSVQVKLLRFLQERCIERVGGRERLEIDARVLAATNVDLSKALREGSFREDFYYRLAVVELELPPLREREGDIELLSKALLETYASESGKTGLDFSKSALKAMLRHPWPGNVREMQNRIRRAVIMRDGKRISAENLELEEKPKPAAASSLKEAREELERRLVSQALKKHGGKITQAAAELGVSRPTFYELMERLEVPRPGKG